MKKVLYYLLWTVLTIDLCILLLGVCIDNPVAFNEYYGITPAPLWVGWVFVISLFVAPALLIALFTNKTDQK